MVNLSARQLQEANLVSRVSAILEWTQMPPRELQFEITESAVMQNVESATELLEELKRMGLQISIDDFGTGYSSLDYLKRLPLDTIKIDRSFVRDITFDPDDTAIITLARSRRRRVVAEGVETEDE